MKAYVRTCLARLGGVFRRRRQELSMVEEMQAHLEVLTQENIAAGMPPEEARAAAQRRFGGVTQIQEECRDVRRWVWLESLQKDFRFAVRSLARAPGFTLAVVVTLAIGIGATTAMVSVDRIIFPSIPHPDPDRMVVITDPDATGTRPQTPYPFFFFPYRFAILHETASSYAAIGAEREELLNLVVAGDPTDASVGWITSGFFPALAVTPLRGRLFLPSEYRGESGDVAVLSWKFWKKRFAADPGIIGQDLLLGGKSRRVVGVLPIGFRPPLMFVEADVYLPLALSPTPELSRRWLQVVGRLKPSVTLEQARAETAVMHYPFPGRPNAVAPDRFRPQVIPLTAYYETDASRSIWVYLAAVGFLYIIACSNAASLMLARTVTRQKELGVRLALGSGHGRILRLVISESLVLALAGGGAGILIAWISAQAITPLLPADPVLLYSSPSIDLPLLLTALGLSLLTCLLVAIVPAWRVRRAQLSEALKEGSSTLADSRRLRQLRHGLVAAQAALATVLLIGMGLMVQSYVRLAHVDFGFDLTDKLAVAGVLPEGLSPQAYLQLSTRVRDALARLPGVRDATCAGSVPLSIFRSMWNGIKIDGRPDLGDVVFSYNQVSPEYFATLGLSMIAGRGFGGLKPGDPPVMVINQTAARRYFGGSDAIGHHLIMEQFGKWEIIGVVGDVRENGRRAEAGPQFYMPFWQPPINANSLTVLLRMTTPPVSGIEASVRRAAYAVEPRLVLHLDRLTDVARGEIKGERYTMIVLEVLAILALLLAALGLFAVMAYAVAQRQREFGVRLALGAGPGDLARLVVRSGIRIILVGIVLGLGSAWGLTRFLQSVLFETSPTNAVTFAVVAVILFVSALVACWLPARRAARVDAARLLRAE